MVVVNNGSEIIYDLKLEVTVENEGIFLRTSVIFKTALKSSAAPAPTVVSNYIHQVLLDPRTNWI
jgi:hypothetical protein